MFVQGSGASGVLAKNVIGCGKLKTIVSLLNYNNSFKYCRSFFCLLSFCQKKEMLVTGVHL